VSLTIFGLRHNAAANLSLVLLRPDGTSAHLLNGNCFGLLLGAISNEQPPTGPYSFAPFDGQARARSRPAPHDAQHTFLTRAARRTSPSWTARRPRWLPLAAATPSQAARTCLRQACRAPLPLATFPP
jgi:hypothetical protein